MRNSIDGAIDENLLETYVGIVFKEKNNIVYSHIYDLAVGWRKLAGTA